MEYTLVHYWILLYIYIEFVENALPLQIDAKASHFIPELFLTDKTFFYFLYNMISKCFHSISIMIHPTKKHRET